MNPDDDEANPYKRDCLRSPGHDGATIPDAEVEMRRFDALVYREYLDAGQAAVRVPANGRLTPPGYYMLFVVTADDIPSEGRFIQIS